MTDTFDTTVNAQECKTTTTEYHIEMPCAGSNASATISTQEPTVLGFGPEDIVGMSQTDGGMLLITFKDGQTLTIENFAELAAGNQLQNLQFENGESINLGKLAQGLSDSTGESQIDVASVEMEVEQLADLAPAAGDEFVTMITKPVGAIGVTGLAFDLSEGENYTADFNKGDIKSSQLNDEGQLVITFQDGTQTILNNYSDAGETTRMTLADGTVVQISSLLITEPVAQSTTVVFDAPEVVEVTQTKTVAPRAPADADKTAFMSAEELAQIEAAAGGNGPAGALGNTGANFGSSVTPIGLGAVNAVGPIGVTSLQFGLPELQDPIQPTIAARTSTPIGNPILVTNTAFGYEDNAINYGIYAQPSVLDGSKSISVVVSGIPAGWTPVLTDPTTANGVFDSGAGTWTINLGAGQILSSGPVFKPPLNSDVDITPLSVTVTQTDIPSQTTQTVSGKMNVDVDAVADLINLTASDVNGLEDNPVALNIQMSLTDVDNSEQISEVLIAGVPTGFSLNFGTNQGNGIWSVPIASVPNLQLTPPANYSGTVNLEVRVTNIETNFSGNEFDLTNNTNVTIKPFNVVFGAVPDAPSLVVDNPIVKEDGSIDMNISATLEDTDGSEYLVVTMTGIDNTWGVSVGANNGTYDSNTGIWTITMPAGQNYAGKINFTPPANSDLDMPNLVVTARAIETSTNAGSSVTANVEIITDAVADAPTINAGADASVMAGQSVALTISNALTDTDGSETLGNVTISGLPAGYSLNQGTDLGGGVWSVTQAQLTGLMLNTPANGNGAVTLTASVTSTETANVDNEVDFTDNAATNSDQVVITVSPDTNPPLVTFGANGSGKGEVYEDGSVFVPITATIQGNAPQELTVTLTGVPSTWTIATGVNNGSYNSATGTWTITMAPNTNYSGGLTFTPPADSDVDLTGLVVTASSRNTTTNVSLSSNTSGQVIVDAVADTPDIDGGANSSVTAGQSVALTITNATTDTDNSESLGNVTISGVPAGYSLNQGTDLGGGIWEVTQAQLVNLRLNTPANGNGNVTLTVSVTATEVPITDIDFDATNDTATNSDTVVISVNPPQTPPLVTFGANGSGSAQVLEDGSVFVPITATLTGNATNQQLMVELTGVPATWTITTGVNNGTYNSATGTWTITMPANTNYTGGLTFMPPADSDVDLTGLTVTATSKNLNNNAVETATTPGQVIVDAVADLPTLNVNNVNGTEGSSIALNITDALKDVDGSESLENVTISGIPAGFSLSAGTNLGGGVWSVTQAQLTGLKLNTPQNYSGTVPLTASVTTTERVTDTDFNLNNNTATVTKPFNVVISDTANPPTLTVDGTHRVYEDGSVFVPFSATLTGDASEILTVSVSGINPAWTITTGAANGTYNSATGVWTITMPAGQNYTGGLTFAPPANSDLDLTGLNVKANAFAPATNTNSSVTEVIQIITDAVADMPTVDAGANASVVAGQQVSLNITNGLTDNDGSESLGNVKISGLPAGYTLSAGTDLGGGVWSVTQAQLVGLKLNTPANGNGNITLTVSTTSTERVNDNEFDLTNNAATNTDTVVVTVTPDNRPPEVTFGANGSGSAQVLEDGSVLVPITATIQGNAPQQLTVEVSGIPSTWTIATGVNNGTYNSATGIWTITVPAGQNYNGGLTFTPPANSDVDLTGLVVKATSTNTITNTSLSTSTNGAVIVDAVADMPTLNVANASGEQGQVVALNISDALTDTDGSESLGNVTISGVPSGYSLTVGTNLGGGVWSVTQAQLSTVKLSIPNNATPGSFNLTVAVTSTERVTDTDFNLNNNTATNTQILNVAVAEDDVPVIITPSSPISYESQLGTPNVLNGTIIVDYGTDGPGTVCVPQGGVFSSTGQMAPGGLQSGGVPVVVSATGNTYTGVANGLVVFTLIVSSNGSYNFTQYHPLDHASATNPNEIINLNFAICAKDNEGDMSVSTLTVRVQDTGPVLRDDAVTMWSCDWAARGNVITNNNQTGNGADILSVEDPNEVISVTHNGVEKSFKEGGDAMVVHGDHGVVFMFKNGSYAYISNESAPDSSHRETFSYKVADGDGDIDSAVLTLNVTKAPVSANPDADYGNQTIFGTGVGFNEAAYIASENAETNIYQTSKTDGAMVFGWTGHDELAGNAGDDILLGWTGSDTLYGYGGNDVLMGEYDSNVYYGGTGADAFAIAGDKAFNQSRYDTIMDFNLNEGDVIMIGDLINGFNSGSDITKFVKLEAVGNDVMLRVNTDGQGTDFYNAALIKNHAGIDINNLDVKQLYDQGHIDVA